jgi:class 3 adenylate cyclase
MIAYDQARGIIGQYEIIGSLFRASAPMESIAIHDSFNTTNYDHTKRLLTVIGTQYAQGNAEIDATMYLNEWRNVCTTWQNERLIVGDRTLVVIDMSAQGDVISATSTVVWISVVVSGSFIIGILAGIGMAYSITGPWRRLSKLQDATIRKFVPSGFMKLVNTKSITDMVLGKYVERDITMLLVEIKNMKTTGGPSETLHFLNDFLSTTCPIVRKNGGFVDRYTGDGFTALFRDSKSAMVSAVEIQSQVEVYNSRASHQIVVGVTTHSAYALIGTVGENERMDGCVISKESSVNPRLQTVGDKLEAPIVATRQALSNRINHRFLGTVTHKQLPIEVFEVFGFGDALKRASTDVFNAAAKAFDKKQFFKAKEIFDKVINMNNEDKVAQSMARMCKKIIDQVELDLHRMRANEILAILPLRNALEEQCKKEFSTENIDLWKHIQTFRTMTDPVEMERFAKQLYSTYCDINGECSVNITDITRNTVKKKLFDPEYKIDKNLFDKLNIEIVSNLEDTAARFKDTESCRELYLAEMNIEPLL